MRLMLLAAWQAGFIVLIICTHESICDHHVEASAMLLLMPSVAQACIKFSESTSEVEKANAA